MSTVSPEAAGKVSRREFGRAAVLACLSTIAGEDGASANSMTDDVSASQSLDQLTRLGDV